jgi:acetyl-CoA acyltransferase
MHRVAIVDSARTAIARAFQGRLSAARPDDLAARCVDALLARNRWLAPEQVDDCVIGCAFPEGAQGMNLGRNVAVLSGLGRDVAGLTITRYCSSGLDAVAHAAARIAAGQAEVMVAGGTESISMTMKSINAASLFNPAIRARSPGTYLDMNLDAPAIPFWKRAFRSTGGTAELIARREGISRAQQDACALRSQQRTAAAEAAGWFREELIPVEAGADPGAGGEAAEPRLTRDECPRPDSTLAGLAALQPAFSPTGSITAGNAAPAADGAAALLLVSEQVAQREQLPVLGWFCGYATVGCAPEAMAEGAPRAVAKLLAAQRLSAAEIDLFELNEVFAAQLLYSLRVLELDEERVNPAGGALSLGHPFGMTGARLVGQTARHLRRTRSRRAVVAMCVGGGIGAAALIET